MSAFHDIILAGASGQQGYQISRSVRLRSSASAYFNRTFGTPTNGNVFTWSGWVKRGAIGAVLPIFNPSLAGGEGASFNSSNQLVVAVNGAFLLVSTPVYRDPSAWYHIMLVADMGNATASLRFRVYVNGTEVTAWSTDARATYTSFPYWNKNAVAHYIGYSNAYPAYGDGYLTEVNFIDGQALTPSSFGETDAVTGVWKPKKYAGTYGNNGFYLNFADNSAATPANLGKDSSGAVSNVIMGSSTNASTTLTVVSITGISVGNIVSGPGIPSNTYVTAIGALQVTLSQAATSTNASQNYTFSGNNWTPNNISLTAGTTYDSMIDTPTAYADGGNGRGNYAVMNPLSTIAFPVSNGNLSIGASTTSNRCSKSSIAVSSGKWYWEFKASAMSASGQIAGVCSADAVFSGGVVSTGYEVGYYSINGNKYVNGTASAYGASWTTSDTIGVALDVDSGTVTFYKNNTSQGSISITAGQNWVANWTGQSTTDTVDFNFGQRPFAYTPPTGFKALNTQNLPDSTIKAGNKYFDINLYTGTGASQSIVNAGGFQPDLVWTKSRNNITNNGLFDSVRGGSKLLISELTDAEYTGTYLSSFNSNGFTIGATASSTLNASTYTYVGWQWKKGATQGFDIVTYTGDGTSARAISHSLGVAPKMVIVKSRSLAGENWNCWHTSLGGNSYRILLNTTGAVDTGSPTIWGTGGINPTSTTFQVGSSSGTNGNSSTYVAYLFAEVAGFSRFGSYTGNGSTDGPFVYCGFRPRFILWKQTSAAGQDWQIEDTSREQYNSSNRSVLFPDLSNAEVTDAYPTDFLSNGFKIRNSGNGNNQSGQTYIYAAFAENPFKNSLAR